MQAVTDVPVIDPREIAIFARGDDWRARYDELRETYPFFRVDGDPTIWFTRYDACHDIVMNGDLFWDGSFGHPGPRSEYDWSLDPAWDRESAAREVRNHVALRQKLQAKFSPRQVREWEGVMHRIAAELIDGFVDKGEVEFIESFARRYFPILGAEMLGAPRSDWDMLVQWEGDVFKVPAETDTDEFKRKRPASDYASKSETGPMASILDYINDMMVEKRKRPDGKFVSWVVQEEAAGNLSPTEARWACTIFVLGSGHTVAAHLSYIFHHLAQHPEMQERLGMHPDKINSTCEELLRIYPLSRHTRTVTEDVEFHGCQLRKGDTVLFHYSMVNRDPRGPGFDHIDFDRKRNLHLAFNQGWRQCLGVHFARSSRSIAVQKWHERIPRYRIADIGRPLVEQVYAGVGYHELPLTWDLR